MGSTRAGAGGESTGRGADLLRSAASLRWARPDLTGAIADHVLETAGIAGDQERWLGAAAWAVHARSATGDGRETASDVIGQLSRWGPAALDGPAARRLRIELAHVAAAAGEVETARGLLGPVVVDENEPELRADLFSVRARCAVEDAPDGVAEALRAASEVWKAVPGPEGEVGGASVALISAVVDRRNRRPDSAVDHAAEGLMRLERGRGDGPAGTPSGHLAAALAAEWISALLDAGRTEEASDGCVPLMPRLSEPARPSRQLALLRLTVARAVATGDGAGSSVGLLEQAAEDAAASDAPDLESVCRTALGALQEKTGPLETALATLRLGVAAERRDRTRIARFRSALAELPPGTLRSAPAESGLPRRSDRARRAAGGDSGSPSATRRAAESSSGSASGHDWDAFLRNANGTGRPSDTGGRGGKRRREDDREPVRDHRRDDADGSGDDQPSRRSRGAAEAERSRRPADRRDDPVEPTRTASGSDRGVSWEEAGGSPIGDLLFRSLRSGDATGRDAPANGSDTRRRNGSNGYRSQEATGRHGSGSAEPTRNGHTRPRSDEGTDGPASHRPSADDESPAGRGSDASSWASSARSWLSRERPTSASWTGSEDRSGGRRAERSRDEDRWPLADIEDDDGASGSRRSRSESRSGSSGSQPSGPESSASRSHSGENDPGTSMGGRRHRAEDPWSTGQWPGVRADEDDRDRTDRSGEPTELLSPTSARSGADDPEGWLRAALADLDRVWGPTGPGGESSRTADTTSSGPRRDETDERCTVVIDVARDGRRFAGRRAGAVVRAVADRLTDRLPQGARLKLGESDALSITLPGWDRTAATEWLHRTLPGLLAGFDAGEDLPSAQLRAAVHDAHGPVGAQILQSLDRSAGRRPGGGTDGGPDRQYDLWGERADRSAETGGSGRRRAEDREPREWERAADRDVPDWRRDTTGSENRHGPTRAGDGDDRRHNAGNGSDGGANRGRRYRGSADAESAGTPGADAESADTQRVDTAGADRAPAATDRDGDLVRDIARNPARDPEHRDERGTSGDAGSGKPGDEKTGTTGATAESTEGLGIADLLAGALAAYRAI